MAKKPRALTYARHLQLDRLLTCQQRQSELQGRPAHDEMLFIIVHQAYELWFKQILFELERIDGIFAGPVADDSALGFAVQGLERIAEIQRLLLQQLDVLETMTPLDFLDFRDVLFPASGFQSLQFRLIETRLGLRREDRLTFDGRAFDRALGAADRRRIAAAEAEPSLHDRIEGWLARTPFVDMAGFNFLDSYRAAVAEMLAADAALARAKPGIGPAELAQELAGLEAAQSRFDAIFDREQHRALRAAGDWRLSWQALQAALFINLYRDEPAAQLPFRLLSALMDLDEGFANWRYRHALMVQRMIGRKVGTGGSSGHDYLRRTAERHRVFGDLFTLSTYFIPRSKLPALPPEVRAAMAYRYSTAPG